MRRYDDFSDFRQSAAPSDVALSSPSSSRADSGSTLAVEVRRLSKSFGSLKALDGISFGLKAGRILAVIGPSGSGKSTLLRIICQLESPDEGEVLVSGLRLGESQQQDRRILSKTGLVFQSFNLFPHLTVVGNITLPYSFLHKGCSKAEAVSVAMELLDRVRLSDKADSYPFMLSGGEAQRAAIARSLALKPDVLCFDEPTSALDMEMTKSLTSLIRRINREERNAIIIVTHDLAFAKDVSDDVLFLDKGVMAFFSDSAQAFDSSFANERMRRFTSDSDRRRL